MDVSCNISRLECGSTHTNMKSITQIPRRILTTHAAPAVFELLDKLDTFTLGSEEYAHVLRTLNFLECPSSALSNIELKFTDRDGKPHSIRIVRCTTNRFAYTYSTDKMGKRVLRRFEYLPFCACVLETFIGLADGLYIRAMEVASLCRGHTDTKCVDALIRDEIKWVIRVLSELTTGLPWETNADVGIVSSSLGDTIEIEARAMFYALSDLKWHHQHSIRLQAVRFEGLPGKNTVPIRQILSRRAVIRAPSFPKNMEQCVVGLVHVN